MIARRSSSSREPVEDLPEPGESIRTEVYAWQERGVWSVSDQFQAGATLHYAVWRYPALRIWKRILQCNDSHSDKEERTWSYSLLKTSIVPTVILKHDRLAESTFREIMAFRPAMIPMALLRRLNQKISLSMSENLRIERECFSLWASSSSGLRNPHPILSEVVWAMGLYEKFGLQTWPQLDEMHVKVYSVLRKAMECYSQAMDMNSKASTARALAQKMTGIGPGGVYRRGG